ncbi:MAG: DUF1295 domain-containing protein, partial [Helicobacteraceae bacterium]|nr:DUF1295 domain-containing protein [Helicobacteraceae bacterium]
MAPRKGFSLSLSLSERFASALTVLAVLISALGVAIRVYTIGYKHKGTSGRNTKTQQASALNTKGIYSLTRNPLYLGNFLIGWGVIVYTHSLTLN